MWVLIKSVGPCTSAQVNAIEAYYQNKPGYYVDPQRNGPDNYTVHIYQWR